MGLRMQFCNNVSEAWRSKSAICALKTRNVSRSVEGWKPCFGPDKEFWIACHRGEGKNLVCRQPINVVALQKRHFL